MSVNRKAHVEAARVWSGGKKDRGRAVIEESPSARGGKEVWFGTGTLGVATNDDAPTR